jgi:hypothetical protein
MTSQEPIRRAAVAHDGGFAASQAIDKAIASIS